MNDLNHVWGVYEENVQLEHAYKAAMNNVKTKEFKTLIEYIKWKQNKSIIECGILSNSEREVYILKYIDFNEVPKDV